MNTSLNAGKGSTTNNTTNFTMCAAYIRTGVSGEVDDCMSMAQQKSRLEEYAFERGWTICRYYEDEGFSGLCTERPALRQLMEDAKKHCFDRVLVLRIDRLARRIEDFTTMVTKLARLSIDVISTTQAFDSSTAVEQLMCRIFATLAQCENEMLAGQKPLETPLTSSESCDTPATRFLCSTMAAFMKFERDQYAERGLLPEPLWHNLDTARRCP